MQPLVAFAAHKKHRAVKAPGYLDGTYDWRAEPGSPDNTDRIQDHYTVAPLSEALGRVYSTEAHCVSYVVFRDGEPLEHQPRLAKSSIEWVRGQGYDVRLNTLIVDVDNPRHADNTDLTVQTWVSRIRSTLPEYGFYITPRGVRLIALLDEWVDPDGAEERLETIFRHLEAVGIAPAEESRKCRDWTRHMKLPHFVSEKYRTQYLSPVVDISTMRPQSIDPTPIVRRRAERGSSRRGIGSFTRTAPPAWSARIERLSELCRGRYEGRRNDLSMALAGALLGFQVVPETVPAIVAEVATRAGWNDPRLHHNNAVLTVGKWQDRQRVTGLQQVRHMAPEVADALEAIGSATAEERARALNDLPPPQTLPVDVAVAQMQAEMRSAYGLVVLRAQCGLGKSHAARAIAQERALRPTKPDAKRAPNNSKTGFSVPNHKLALQHAERLRSDGVSVRRVFGVLSVVREDGTPECVYAKQARHLSGGQSIPRVFCEGNGRLPCEYRNECSAYGGADGPDDARVIVGPHALLSQIDAEVGTTGLLVIDEPPDLLETQEFTVADIELAIRCKGYFARRYAGAMAPMLDVVHQWVANTSLLGDRERNFAAALKLQPNGDAWSEAVSQVGTGDPLEAARLAFDEEHPPRLGYAPPIEQHHILSVRTCQKTAKDIGEASRVFWMLWNACQPDRIVSTRVEEYPDKRTKSGTRRVLLVTGMRTELADALAAPHPTVVLDANADLQVPIYQRVIAARELGGVPRDIDSLALRFRYREFYACDGASVERTMVMWGASRKAWLVDGQLTDAFVNAVERAVRWALERPEQAARVCVVSFPVVEVALRAALGHPGAAEAWVARGQEASALPGLVERLKPILARLPGTLELAHYGDLRGLDQWKDADALVTLGDPVQNLGAVRHDAMFIGLPDPDERVHGLTRAELEQAHGRLRTVHRTKPARSLHIGRVLPGGWHGAKIMGRSRAEDWARGGELGKAFGHLGAEHGSKGKEFGVLGAEHADKGAVHGWKGALHGPKGAEHGSKGREHGPKGAEFGARGAEAGRSAEQPNRNQSDMSAGEVQTRVGALGGKNAAAEILGITVRTLTNYYNGTRSIPQPLADRLREAFRGRNDPPGGGGPLPDEDISLH